MLRGDLPRLSRATSIVTESASSPIKRSKPLKYAYEKEIVLYAHHKKLEYFSTECIYSPEAFRGSARALVKNLEKIRPSAILDIVRSGEDMARLVPESVTGGCAGGLCSSNSRIKQVGPVREDEVEGGCGSANGRTSGNEMAEVEQKLRADEEALRLETEVDLTTKAEQAHQEFSGEVGIRMDGLTGRKSDPKSSRRSTQESPHSKRLPEQRIGKCSRCGYMSSQSICKACNLLEGLNRNRPQKEVDSQDDPSTKNDLDRPIAQVAITNGDG